MTLPLNTDCIAPYQIDVFFDALNDDNAVANNEFTSCGKLILFD